MQASRKFYSSLGLLIVLNAVIKPLWIFAIDRQVQNTVGTFDYGSYFSLYNLSLVLGFVLDWGFTVYFNRQIAAQQDGILSRAGTFLLLKGLFIIFYTAVIVTVAYITGVQRWDLVAGVLFIQVFSSLFLFFRAIITASQWFRTDAWLSVLDKTLMILICGSFLFFPALVGAITIRRFLLIQSTCTALAMATAWIIVVQREVRFSIRNISEVINKKLLKEMMPFALITLLMPLHYRLDGFLLERIHPEGAYQAGIYASAYRLLDAGNMVGLIFSGFFLPFISRLHSQGEPVSHVLLTIRHLLLPFAIGVSMMAIFMAPWLQSLLYHHQAAESISVFQFCLPALIGYTLVNIYGTVLTATGHIYIFCKILFIAVILNCAINILLIPAMGARGSAMAALISHSMCGLMLVYETRRLLDVRLNTRSILYYTLIAVALAGIFIGGNYLQVNPWSMVIAGASATFLLMVAGKLVEFTAFRVR